MSEPFPLSHLGSILSLRVILVRPKPAPSSAIGGPQQLCFRQSLLLAVSMAVSRAPRLSCTDPVMTGLLHHPDEMRLLLSLSQTWAWGGQSREETREKQQATCGHRISQHLKTRSNGTPKTAWTGEDGATERA